MEEILKREIKDFEKEKIRVMVVDKGGKQVYVTEDKDKCAVCSGCKHLQVIPHPDPYDWFESDDVDVVCNLSKTMLENLIRPYEVFNVKRPAFCPLYSNVLTKKQQENFNWAKKIYKERE